jgi:hypothetical protein
MDLLTAMWLGLPAWVVLIDTGIKMLVMMDEKPDLADNPVLKLIRNRPPLRLLPTRSLSI